MAVGFSHDQGEAVRQGRAVIEVIGLVARIVFELVIESFPYWGSSDRRTYRRYRRELPAGEKLLTRREWRAAQRSAGPPGRATAPGGRIHDREHGQE
ncbi:hypothetical protein [Arthrobacter bussei]|uniref:Uncharacterized protein n=1 Tax=Arthrobacter bussei TaxID=2594179 RepID=A0A7X1NSK9_9MICC|nr:hypothetical protein [Arthrobacter bussei]MPY12050.1 hypothetical protein [Arthrobacter bussei]